MNIEQELREYEELVEKWGKTREERNQRLTAAATSFELSGAYTNGVFAEAATLEEAETIGREHHHNHMGQGFNLSCDYTIWALDNKGERLGTIS